VDWFSTHVSEAGFQVMQTFDLQTARTGHSFCTCPHHGTGQCDCQMVVLLVFDSEYPPASVVAHGQDGQTWFMLVPSYQKKLDARYETRLQDALAAFLDSMKPDEWTLAA
jgi:uncharacterized Zn finger protein